MILLDGNRIQRTLKRMAYQIVEEAHGAPIHLVGLNNRGSVIALRMKQVIEKATGQKSPLDQLNVDLEETFSFKKLPEDNPVLVLVDDVIFSGKTLQKAIDKIPDLDHFQKICVAVLIDRGHRKFPVHAAIVGVHIPTKLNEQVKLLLTDKKPDKVILEKV